MFVVAPPQVSNRTERLRQRVEADSDTTAAALRTISATFDNTLAGGMGPTVHTSRLTARNKLRTH